MKIRLKTINEILMTEGYLTSNRTKDEILCYIPERFFGEVVEAEHRNLKYADVYIIENGQWVVPVDFVLENIE